MSEKKKPVVRFAGFTSDWEQRKLGDCFTERCESMPDGELISVTINDGIKKFSELGRHDNSNDDKSKYKKVCAGDIAYNSMRMWQGASGCSPYEGIVSPAYTVLTPNSGINSKCMAYQFKLPATIHTFKINSQGITSDNWNLKFPALSEIEIYVSPYEQEQAKIAAYFANLDHLITLHQRKCDKLKNVKKSMLEKMFPKNGRKVSEIRFAGFTDNWEQRNDNEELEIRSEEWYIVSIGDIVSIGNGKDYKHLSDGNIPVYGTGGYMLSVSEALSYDDAIGIGRKGTIDRPYVLKAPYWTVDTLFYCIPQNNIDLNFIYAVFQTIDWKKLDESTGVPSLSKENIANYSLLIPRSVDIQRKIGRFFKNFDNLITLHQRKLEKLQNIKKSCLEKMFV